MNQQVLFIFFILISQTVSVFASTSKILFIGDSHLYSPFGKVMYKALSNQGYKVHMLGNCGATVSTWKDSSIVKYCYWEKRYNGTEVKVSWSPQGAQSYYRTTNYHELLKDDSNIVIVELVSNYAYDTNANRAVTQMRQLAKDIIAHHKKCIWISTPARRHHKTKPAKELDQWVHEAVSDLCTVLYPSKIMQYPATGGDGIHYWPKHPHDQFSRQIKLWAQYILQALGPY